MGRYQQIDGKAVSFNFVDVKLRIRESASKNP